VSVDAILTAGIEIATLAMFHAGQHLALRRTVALQLVRDDHTRHILEAVEQLAKELFRSLLIAPTLHQEVEEVIVLINGPSQVMALPVDCQKYFIHTPFVP
jgi:hypothetical protein